ncbi:putative tyrosine carboxypeptidase MATCAP2 [Oscarella lobularis]|uniref:putative tyrosine carboxypeptidase MATCAP2 n=1 Tax=Oscarella lobularis TaxID=121494 RepID=UPI0033139DB4
MSYRRLSCSSFPNVLSFDGEEEIERVDDRDALSSRHRRSSLETTLKSSSVVSLPPLAPTPSKTTGGATSKALKRWKGNVLSAVKPINEASEKRKFFHDKTSSYNPQFVYRKSLPLYVHERYADASSELLAEAVCVLRIVLRKYGSFEKYEERNGGRILSDAECLQYARKYLRAQGISEVRVVVSRDLVPHAHMTHDKRGPILEMKSGVLREHRFEGLLNHEIGTHYIRARNEKFQPWFKSGRKLYNLLDKNPTEEGLASLHGVLHQTRGQYLFRSALLYYAASKAQTTSFLHLFHNLSQYVSSPDARWNYCVRVKRGIRDTSKPGCFCKDQVYFKGALQILKYRHEIDFNGLFMGKVAWQDVARLKEVSRKRKIMLPAFIRDERKYKEHLEDIMTTNEITEEKLLQLDL